MLSDPEPAGDSIDTPVLSVVIPNRNRANLVRRAVESVLATPLNIEVVVSDDASDDASDDDAVDQIRSIPDGRCKLVTAETQGGANLARNRGAQACAAPIISFLDSDDVFMPGRPERLVDYFGAHPEIGCTIDGFVNYGSNGRTKIHRLPQVVPDKAALRHMLITHQLPLTNSTITVRRTAFDAIGGFDKDFRRHQDRDLLLRLLAVATIAFGDATDVEKHRVRASISHEFEGYIQGLDAMAGKLPESSDPTYMDFFRYLAARGVLKPLLQGHLRAAFNEMKHLEQARHLPRGLIKNVARYFSGRRFRYNLPKSKING